MTTRTGLAGRTVAITGAAGAYGRELALAFHRKGARLVLSDVLASPTGLSKGPERSERSEPPELPEVPELPELPPAAFRYLQADLASLAGVDAFADALLQDGPPDVLVNNAGLFPFVDLLEMAPDSFDAILGVNLRAPFRLMQRVGAAMAQRGSGVICNISSGAASVIRENGAVYGASKAALEHLTRAFALRLGPAGVRVNAVRPGLRGDTRDGIPAAHLQRVGSTVPLRRLAQPGEVASVVTFLCSDEAAFVTGETLAVDGGNGINRRPPA